MTQPHQQPQPQLIEPLTQRETEVIYMLFNFELDYSEIAQELGVTKAAVTFHLLNIFNKLGVDSRFAAVCKYSRVSRSYRKAFIQSLSVPPPTPTGF